MKRVLMVSAAVLLAACSQGDGDAESGDDFAARVGAGQGEATPAPTGTVAPPEHDPHVTNICFAGAGSRDAWVTSSGRGRLYRCTWPVDGLDLAFRR